MWKHLTFLGCRCTPLFNLGCHTDRQKARGFFFRIPVQTKRTTSDCSRSISGCIYPAFFLCRLTSTGGTMWAPMISSFCIGLPVVGTGRRWGWEKGEVRDRIPLHLFLVSRSLAVALPFTPRWHRHHMNPLTWLQLSPSSHNYHLPLSLLVQNWHVSPESASPFLPVPLSLLTSL